MEEIVPFPIPDNGMEIRILFFLRKDKDSVEPPICSVWHGSDSSSNNSFCEGATPNTLGGGVIFRPGVIAAKSGSSF
jgi:hypothetical protein